MQTTTNVLAAGYRCLFAPGSVILPTLIVWGLVVGQSFIIRSATDENVSHLVPSFTATDHKWSDRDKTIFSKR